MQKKKKTKEGRKGKGEKERKGEEKKKEKKVTKRERPSYIPKLADWTKLLRGGCTSY